MTPALQLTMVVGLADSWVAVIGGMVTATITGCLTLAGVLLQLWRQHKPIMVETVPEVDPNDHHCADCTECRRDLIAMTVDRDHWRELARMWAPRRREDDVQDSES